jgi:perosamine synthetase
MQEYELLEKDLERWTGQSNIVCTSSGTSALHLALESFQLPNPKDREVILCDYNMIACARAISLSGMTPVVVDCTENLLIDPTLIEQSITDKTRVIMATHIYGRLCDMQAIHDIAAKYGLFVIEDMAEAHGCIIHPNTHAACWSFYKNKIVHGEEGGAVCFKEGGNEARIARQLRNMGFNEPHDYTHIPRGHNYRMSNLHSTPIRNSLKHFKLWVSLRRIIESWYEGMCPVEWRMPYRHSPWVYDLRVPGLTAQRQTAIITELRARGIQARHGFKPISSQEEYEFIKRRVPRLWAERMSQEVITLPLSYEIEREHCEMAFQVITSMS